MFGLRVHLVGSYPDFVLSDRKRRTVTVEMVRSPCHCQCKSLAETLQVVTCIPAHDLLAVPGLSYLLHVESTLGLCPC
jgi:hypothetical protein